jgi:alpha-amylase
MDRNFAKAYDPFLSFLEKHPDFLCVLHYSGPLLDYLEQEKPAFMERLAGLVSRGQVELLTGACYEPVAILLPENDLVAQAEELSRRLLERFGYYPRGFWLAERVWEPQLAPAIAACGVAYTLVDGENFARGGVEESKSHGFFVAENQGRPLNLFPINQTVRRGIPFDLPEKVVERLLAWAEESPGGLVVWGDDGEKLGAWPGTHKWVYEEGWLERFFSLLQENRASVRLVTLRDYFSQNEPLGRVCVPAGSYGEMMEWSGGDFRNFLVRYEESNWMHKRMLSVSRKVSRYAGRVEEGGHLAAGQVSLRALQEARRQLWQSQCNDAYWHGVFGGLYLPWLRRAVYQHLLRAEATVDDVLGGNSTEVADFDGDGHEEIRASNGALSAFFRPREGGALCEIDFLPKAENLTATLRRRRETYHEGMQVAEDWHGRYCFIDHFLRDGTNPADFSQCRYGEQGDFANQPYACRIGPAAPAEGGGSAQADAISLSRRGHVWVGESRFPLLVQKRFSLPPATCDLQAEYRLENPTKSELRVWFGVEMNFLLSAFSLPERRFEFLAEDVPVALDGEGERSGVETMALCDEWAGIRVQIDPTPASDLWFFPVKTLSRSEKDIREVCQCACLLFHQRLSLPAGGEWKGAFRLSISALRQ